MANAQKFAKTATGHLAAHFERKQMPVVTETGDIVMEYVKFGNQDIDPSKTHLNYNLGPDHGCSQVEFIRHRTQEAHCMQRADVNVLVSWVVTLPTHNEYGDELIYTPDQQDAFFRESYAMLAERYGRENVVSAYVHLDETTPHMHFAFVPITSDKAWNKKHPDRPRDKVSAKEVLTRTDLQHFHTDLQEHLDARCGRGLYPVLNGATDGGNRSILELKAARAAEELATVEAQLWSVQMELQEVKVDLQRSQDALERAGEALSEKLDKLQELQPEVQALEGRRDGLRSEIQDLREQISDLTAAMQKKLQEAQKRVGSSDELQRAIKAAKADKEKNQRLEALEEVAAATPENRMLLQEALLRQAARDKQKKRSGRDLEK